MSRISEWFWSERVWLPENVTWNDVTNSPDKNVVYADIKDFLYVFPLMVVIILTRFVVDRYFLTPLGKLLKIPDKYPGKVPYNAKLEAAYLSSKKTNFSILSKQLDMTERQIERWWRIRCNQDKPSKLYKFRESSWKAIFHVWVTMYGLYVLWNKEWLWDKQKCFEGWPHQGISDDIRWYYMFETASTWCLLIFQFRAVKRKDTWQMYVHHFATIFLLSVSWICNTYRIGTIVLILHDCGDISLELGKSLKYASYQTACNCVFVVFMITWILTRIIIYPMHFDSITRGFERAFPLFYVLQALLWLLYLLHIIWTWYILKIAYNSVKSGVVAGDSRSSGSEDEISSHTD